MRQYITVVWSDLSREIRGEYYGFKKTRAKIACVSYGPSVERRN